MLLSLIVSRVDLSVKKFLLFLRLLHSGRLLLISKKQKWCSSKAFWLAEVLISPASPRRTGRTLVLLCLQLLLRWGDASRALVRHICLSRGLDGTDWHANDSRYGDMIVRF